MHVSSLRQQTRLGMPQISRREGEKEVAAPIEQFTPSEAAAPDKQEEKQASKPRRTAPLPLWMRATTAGLAGLVGMMALTGCTGQPAGPAQVETQVQKEARQQLSQRLNQIESQMKDMQAGNGQQQSEQITRQIMDAARTYSQSAGKDGPGVVNELRKLLLDHPALTITTMFALGTATGIGLEKIGLTDGASAGASQIWEAANKRPLLAGGIALAAAGGAAYLIHQVVTTEGAVPEKPTGTQAQTLESRFESLEARIAANPNVDAKEINREMMDAISQYQKDSGKPWQNVVNDVKAFAYEHPVLAATVITGAGVATGVVLERAGVPSKVAELTATAFQGSKSAAANVGQFITDHPVASGAVAVGIAAGVGYLAYTHFNAN